MEEVVFVCGEEVCCDGCVPLVLAAVDGSPGMLHNVVHLGWVCCDAAIGEGEEANGLGSAVPEFGVCSAETSFLVLQFFPDGPRLAPSFFSAELNCPLLQACRLQLGHAGEAVSNSLLPGSVQCVVLQGAGLVSVELADVVYHLPCPFKHVLPHLPPCQGANRTHALGGGGATGAAVVVDAAAQGWEDVALPFLVLGNGFKD